MKRVIAACIDRVFEFDSEGEMEKYLAALRKAEKEFAVIYSGERDGGKWCLRVKEQYNKSPLLKED